MMVATGEAAVNLGLLDVSLLSKEGSCELQAVIERERVQRIAQARRETERERSVRLGSSFLNYI